MPGLCYLFSYVVAFATGWNAKVGAHFSFE